MTKGKTLKKIVLTIVGTIFALLAVFPIYYMIITSFKTQAEVYSTTPHLFPYLDFTPSLEAWRMIFGLTEQATTTGAQLMLATKNSLIVSLSGAVVSVMLGSTLAYGITRYRFGRFKSQSINFTILSMRIFPPIVLAMPYYVLFLKLGLTDKHSALILVYSAMNIPLVTWLISDFLRDVPVEIEEAAAVDGLSPIRIFFLITLPIVLPGIVVSGMFCFAFNWNEFLYALTLTFSKAKTLPFQIAGLVSHSGPRYSEIAAQAAYVMVPMLVIEIIANKYIVKGLSVGAVKG